MLKSLTGALKNIGFTAYTSIANRFGYELSKSSSLSLPDDIVATIAFVRPYTMTSDQRIATLCDAVTYIVSEKIEGDIVECGVWKGGSSMAIARTLLGHGVNDRALYLYDTFEGMSEPTDFDREADSGVLAHQLLSTNNKQSTVWAYSPLEEVKRNIASVRYPLERTNFIVGKVEDTIPNVIPKKIALLRLDTDWYESTAHELKHLFPLLSDRGVLIIDDYGHWAGAKKAFDEYFEVAGKRPFLFRVDYSARMAIKA